MEGKRKRRERKSGNPDEGKRREKERKFTKRKDETTHRVGPSERIELVKKRKRRIV